MQSLFLGILNNGNSDLHGVNKNDLKFLEYFREKKKGKELQSWIPFHGQHFLVSQNFRTSVTSLYSSRCQCDWAVLLAGFSGCPAGCSLPQTSTHMRARESASQKKNHHHHHRTKTPIKGIFFLYMFYFASVFKLNPLIPEVFKFLQNLHHQT